MLEKGLFCGISRIVYYFSHHISKNRYTQIFRGSGQCGGLARKNAHPLKNRRTRKYPLKGISIYGQAGICQVRGPPVSWLEQDIEKKLEDERMEKKQTDSVQNRFTAYLMVAVANRRVSYMEQRNRQKEWEYIQVDLLEKNHVDFDAQYRTYMAEQSLLRYLGYGESSECMPEIDSIQLAKCINRLKDRERRILFARVFGELDFAELGEKFGMEPKQAEMAYYYIIRKLRKGMGVRKDEF